MTQPQPRQYHQYQVVLSVLENQADNYSTDTYIVTAHNHLDAIDAAKAQTKKKYNLIVKNIISVTKLS